MVVVEGVGLPCTVRKLDGSLEMGESALPLKGRCYRTCVYTAAAAGLSGQVLGVYHPVHVQE